MKKILALALLISFFPLKTNAQHADSTKAYDSERSLIFSTSVFGERYRANNMFTKDSVSIFGVEERLRLNRHGINALFIFTEIKYEKWRYEDFHQNGPSDHGTENEIKLGAGFGSNFDFFSVGKKKLQFSCRLETKIDILRSIDYQIFSITVEPLLELAYMEKYCLEAGLRLDPYLPTLNCPSIRLHYFFF